ncbi:hypothetical protein [Pseudonocardia sp.]
MIVSRLRAWRTLAPLLATAVLLTACAGGGTIADTSASPSSGNSAFP